MAQVGNAILPEEYKPKKLEDDRKAQEWYVIIKSNLKAFFWNNCFRLQAQQLFKEFLGLYLNFFRPFFVGFISNYSFYN